MLRALLLGLLLCSTAHAERARFHLVRDRMVAHLSKGAQQSERAVVRFPHATGFVVAADRNQPRRILVITNFHVAGNGPATDAPLEFRDGTTARPLRTVAASPELDYAVVEAELVSGPRRDGVEPLELDRGARPLAPGRRIYALGAHTGLGRNELDWTPAGRTIAGGRSMQDRVAQTIADDVTRGADPTGFRTIALGTVLQRSTTPVQISTAGGRVLGVESDLPNSPGMSGAPVLHRATHKVVGLHFGGFGPVMERWTESAVPTDLLLRDLAHKLERGQVHGSDDLVKQLVHGT